MIFPFYMRCFLTHVFVQVYGGATSIMIGSYSWSFSPYDQFSTAQSQSGNTHCIGCAVNVSDVAVTNSTAVSNTTGELRAVFHVLQCVVAVFAVVLGCCDGCCIDMHA